MAVRKVVVARSVALLLAALVGACAIYHPPPQPSIDGLTQGILPDATQPLVIEFGEPIDPTTLTLEIAKYEVDDEGDLPDERGAASTPLDLYFSHDPLNGDTLGTAVFLNDNATLQITPIAPLPIGPQLVLIIESGLRDLSGRSTHYRDEIVFGYQATLTCTAPSRVVPSGTYFFLVQVNAPIPTQVQLWGDVEVDPSTGQFVAAFAKAVRNPDPSRCVPYGLTCTDVQACRTLPAPACVVPSERAGTVDEYPDYIASPADPGFQFQTSGCIVDQPDGTATFANLPVDINIDSPTITLRNTRLSASFGVDSSGVVRGTGALTADGVLLGTIASGPGAGDLTARQVPDSARPTNLPTPTPATTATPTAQ